MDTSNAYAAGDTAAEANAAARLKADNAKSQMRKGILEMCVLAIVAREEAYPSDIIERLKQRDLIVVEGTLYPLLTRLKNEGLLSYSWRESRSGPPRKYFQLTDEGRTVATDLQQAWTELVASVGGLFEVKKE